MFGNGLSSSDTPPTSTDAINVGFSSIGNRHGESSSRRGSRSSGKRSSGSGRGEEQTITPDETTQQEDFRKSTGSTGPRVRSSGGFLLDSVFANGSPRGPDRRGKRKMQDGQLRVGKRRVGTDRLSAESSLRGSPLSREVSVGGMDGVTDGSQDDTKSRPPSMDAAQLVQMALNLSEGRKRHVSNPLGVASGGGQRVSSMQMSNIGTVRAASGTRQRSSHFSETASRNSPDSVENIEDEADQSRQSIPGIGDIPENILYTFTPATLARAEKARKYFELASEHRRLLDSLPALKPDASSSQSRSYNPIQSLRNRRIRIREKRPFPAPPDLWADPDRVNNWISDVESVVENCDYAVGDDTIALPTFEADHESVRPESRHLPTGPRHKRTDTVGSVITRPENSWTIEPTELLADAYWTERGDNKAYIETRRGNPIFPSWQRQRASTPKISIDLHRDRNDSFDQNENGTESEEYGRPSRRRQLLLPLTTGIEKRKPSRLIRRASVSSDGSSKERNVSGRLRSGSEGFENIGPLERHMEQLIAKDEAGELSSPEVTSPDHWNSMLKQPPAQRRSVERLRRGSSASRAGGRNSLEVPRDLRRRTRSADGRVGSFDPGRFSMDADDTGSEPGSPIVNRNMASFGMDLSPPTESRRSIDESRLKLPHLPTFHARNREKNKIGETDFADNTVNALSPILGADSSHPSDSLATPEHLKRHGTAESWTQLQRNNTGSTMVSSKEGSSVGRFLRNRRGKIFKGRERSETGELSAQVSDVSEGEEHISPNGALIRRPTDEDSDASARPSTELRRPKQKFHITNLPSFTSAARDKRIQIESPRASQDDPRRTKRFDRPGPALVTLPQGSELDLNADPTSTRARKTYGQLQPIFTDVGWQGRLVPGSFTPGISQAKRHWSIYDKFQPVEDDKVTARDITRARALLLSSGIKAREIQRRADDPEPRPSPMITRAANVTGQPFETVPLKEEHIVAARMLSKHLTTSLSEYETLLSRFQNTTVRDLGMKIEDLRQRAADQLSNLVHDTSDEADAFTAELNGPYPQQTKLVDDAIEEVLRRRRREFRLLKSTGFRVLELLVVGLLWGIWFLVVVFNTFRKIVVVFWKILRWLFSFY